MAGSLDEKPVDKVAQALVQFSVEGVFPEDSVSSLPVGDVSAGIEALAIAKRKLEAEIHKINEETADEVEAWKANAQSVQDDILRSKALAKDALKRADTPEASGKTIADIEAKASLLIRELNYNKLVQDALKGIRHVNQILDLVEQARNERRILDALHHLEKSRIALDALPVSKSTRALKLLELRASELKESVHQLLHHVWNTLVRVNVDKHELVVTESSSEEPMTLSDAFLGLQEYKEVEECAKQFWQDLERAVVAPRMDRSRTSLSSIAKDDGVLYVKGNADHSVQALYADLQVVFSFLVEKLPPDLVTSISSIMTPNVVYRIKTEWLDSAVPTSLKDMDEFQRLVDHTRGFYEALESLGLPGAAELQEWVTNAPRVWLTKCREVALDSVRMKLSQGIGASREVERVEKQQVSRAETKELVASGAIASSENNGWDATWSDSEEKKDKGQAAEKATAEEDDGADAWGWGDDETTAEDASGGGHGQENVPVQEPGEEDAAEAWGWGDEANDDGAAVQATASTTAAQTREVTLRETYHISSMPEPILALVFAILEDGATLTQDGYNNSPVVTAASGLFSLPTLLLAMFRAVSPYYYSFDDGGNMYLYNDATYLAERLADFAAAWQKREDLSTRAHSMLRLHNEINSLRVFANRAYSNEMRVQKTVLRDMLGGEQNLMHQDDKKAYVESAISRVRAMALTWDAILARSAWYQAVGGLVDAVSTKMIGDVMELASIGQDDAYNIAELMASVTELDELFPPPAAAANSEEMVPTTAQYAGSWLRLKYLSEVLQSNLRDVRYLWMESELSYYFTAEEVVDLMHASFEDNARTREAIREITENPWPRAEA